MIYLFLKPLNILVYLAFIFIGSACTQDSSDLDLKSLLGDNTQPKVSVVTVGGEDITGDDSDSATSLVPDPLPVPTPIPPAGGVLLPLSDCGDEEETGDEECDDGNIISGDGCSSDCYEEYCGDGIVNNQDENCDDDNEEDGDGCDNNCQTEFTFAQSHRLIFDVGYSTVCYKSDTLWEAKCWGSNSQGELGQENTKLVGNGIGEDVEQIDPIRIGSGLSAALISTGGSSASKFTCIVTSAGSLKCFGDNSSGQLGKGDHEDLGDESSEMGSDLTAVSLGSAREVEDADTGGAHVCVILDDSSLKCFGENSYGQLGIESTDDIGDQSGEMGNSLEEVDLGTGLSAKHIAMGEDFSCAILDDDSVKCWGRNDAGQLGQGSTNTLGDQANEMGDDLVAIDLGTGRTAAQIAAGAKHVCAILDNDTVKCWGRNNAGQLGQEDTDNRGDGASEMGDNLLALDLGTGRSATQLALGDNHSCVLLDNDKLKCFGDNSSGQLGQGDTENLGDEASEMGDSLTYINLGSSRTATSIAAGGKTTCAVLDNDELVCFGENASGQLGIGSTHDIGDGSSEMGSNLENVILGFDN